MISVARTEGSDALSDLKYPKDPFKKSLHNKELRSYLSPGFDHNLQYAILFWNYINLNTLVG